MVCAVASRFIDDDRLDIQYSPADPMASKQSKGFEYFRASSGSASPALMSATLYDIQSSVLAILWLLGAATPIRYAIKVNRTLSWLFTERVLFPAQRLGLRWLRQ